MHFDEVYHARTAAEFLQDWRYGISHYIYEWTHPHLAKYAMAGGIVLFAGHDTQATSELGVPVRDAAHRAPPRRTRCRSTARAGDRVWVATGSALVRVRPADAQARPARGPWTAPRALAYDTTGDQLYVGTDAGRGVCRSTWRRWTATSVDAARPGRAAGARRHAGRPDHPPGAVRRRPAPRGDPPRRHGRRHRPGDRQRDGTRRSCAGAVDMAAAGSADDVVATPADVADRVGRRGRARAAPRAATRPRTMPDALGRRRRTPVDRRARPRRATRGRTSRRRSTTERWPGISIEPVPQLAVAGADGVTLLTADRRRRARPSTWPVAQTASRW